MSYSIYAADDDRNIRNLLAEFLMSEGYQVKTFATGDQLMAAFQEKECDLVILDVMMPGTDGLTLCANLRKLSRVPIIILTAKDSDADHVVGVAMGCDDYLTKPFRPTLLNLRVKAIMRRIQMERGGPEENLRCGDLECRFGQRQVLCRGQALPLTITEFSLLAFMMRRPGQAVSRETLLKEIWGYPQEVETRVTDETVRRVRKKLYQAGSLTQLATVWGYGYRLTGPEKAS